MIDDLAEEVIEVICSKMKDAKFFTIMADETADVSNQEQVVVGIRWVGDDLIIHEDFVSLKPVGRCTAEQIVEVLMETLKDLGLKIEDCRGQCYDGASVMSGAKSGVAQRIKLVNCKCLYTHCYGHALNLCVKDSCDKVSCLKDTFDITHEICKLVKKSPQRDTMVKNLKMESGNDEPSVHAFCPTRWTVRGMTLGSIINNHSELMDLWEDSLKITKDTEMKARIIGVQAQMQKFTYFFGCHLGQKMLMQTDNLSASLQSKELSAVEGQELACAVLQILQSDRCDERYDLFWELTMKKAERLDVEVPGELGRKRKRPRRYEDGDEPYVHASPKDHYRSLYFQVYDSVINGIKDRFDQPDFAMYAVMQNILLMAMKGEDIQAEMKKIVLDDKSFESMYAEDINMELLKNQLLLMPKVIKDVSPINIRSTIDAVRTISPAKHLIVSEVVTLVQLLLVAPATNAESERIFSTMRRVKNYLRSTMTNKRLRSLMILSVHKEMTDNLDKVKIANKFVRRKEKRRQIFSVFTKTDENLLSRSRTSNDTAQTTIGIDI